MVLFLFRVFSVIQSIDRSFEINLFRTYFCTMCTSIMCAKCVHVLMNTQLGMFAMSVCYN